MARRKNNRLSLEEEYEMTRSRLHSLTLQMERQERMDVAEHYRKKFENINRRDIGVAEHLLRGAESVASCFDNYPSNLHIKDTWMQNGYGKISVVSRESKIDGETFVIYIKCDYKTDEVQLSVCGRSESEVYLKELKELLENRTIYKNEMFHAENIRIEGEFLRYRIFWNDDCDLFDYFAQNHLYISELADKCLGGVSCLKSELRLENSYYFGI